MSKIKYKKKKRGGKGKKKSSPDDSNTFVCLEDLIYIVIIQLIIARLNESKYIMLNNDQL